MLDPLPIDSHIPAIVGILRGHGAAVVVAPPGAGKTTRVPPALLELGRVILLQPRRVAARSLARRIAGERGWTVGDQVGWQVRFERRFGAGTRLLVATEGVLTARLQTDPLLTDFDVVVLDEFHERSLHADLALALSRQAARARPGLRILVMSATLDAAPVASFLEDCPIVTIPGRIHPLEIDYAPGTAVAEAVRRSFRPEGGHVLAFLPGAPEIRRTTDEIRRLGVPPGVEILPLHGSLDAEEQDRALAPSGCRKVILATNLAETSLTVDGVTEVVDSGLQKVLRYDPALGLDRLETERISRDSAEQRAGRAGRTAPGRVLRLWDRRDVLRDHREPEIERVDLAGPFLEVLAWGEDPRRFAWFERPPRDRAEHAMDLLESLGAAARGRITPLGDRLRRFALSPRLARVLAAAGGGPRAAAVCAVLSEGFTADGGRESRDSDVLAAADALAAAPQSVRRAAAELAAQALRVLGEAGTDADSIPVAADERLLRALLAGFPDRVAKRRAAGSERLQLCTGHGAVLGRESGVLEGEWLVAVDVRASTRGAASEALVRSASRIERSWLTPTRRSVEHGMDATSGAVRAFERSWYGELLLSERAVPPDPIETSRLLQAAMRDRGLDEAAAAVRRRLRFAGIPWDDTEWIRRACEGRSSLAEIDLVAAMPRETLRELDRLAPESIPVPSGRRARLDYRDDGSVSASVKLQELFGLAETPRVGPRGEPVTFLLLAPNGRPVQTTRDLRGFWERTYPEVRKELRGRYPKHPWPEDPWSAPPTHRTTRRPRGAKS